MSAKHTPTPWMFELDAKGGIHILGDNENITISSMIWPTEEERANASLIVRAVNAHDDLVAALREMMALVLISHGNLNEDVNESVAAARAALAKAEA